jgi:hypothetical protein
MKSNATYNIGVSLDGYYTLDSRLFNDQHFTPSVQVRVYWDSDTWYHFKNSIVIDGEIIDLLTEKEFSDQHQNVVDNEGEEVAQVWSDENIHRLASPVLADANWESYNECRRIIDHFDHLVKLDLISLDFTG